MRSTPGSTISAEKLSDLIGAIYDCVLVPENWERVLEAINRELQFAAATLGVWPLRQGVEIINVSVGMDPQWLSDASKYQAEIEAAWGGSDRMAQFPLDEPIIASQRAGPGGWTNTRYHREVLMQRGIVDAVGVTIAREPSLLGYAVFSRHQSAGGIGTSELDGLRLLGPHLRRAATISNLFDMKAIEAASFASVLDSFAFGLVLVDAQLGIVHANDVAAKMLTARDPIESRNGDLALRDRTYHAALERAVGQASVDALAMGPRGIGIPARRLEGEPCVIHVLPLKAGDIRRGLTQRATAALFVAPATAPGRMPADALAVLYDLTPAETRIFELITEGQTQGAIADALGIARSTVKSHLLQVFAKTGCKRQLDLVKLVSGLRSPA